MKRRILTVLSVCVLAVLCMGAAERIKDIEGGEATIPSSQTDYSWATNQAAKWVASGGKCERLTVINDDATGGDTVSVTVVGFAVTTDAFVLDPIIDNPSTGALFVEGFHVTDVLFTTTAAVDVIVRCDVAE